MSSKVKKRTKLTEAPPISATDPVRLSLWVRAGGRCEFYGCNEYLLDDESTGYKEVNLADIAHIVGRKKRAARGNDPLPYEERNKIENLLLLCAEHHNKIIDKGKLAPDFPKEKLLKYKEDHEDQIKYLTSLALPDHETVVVRMLGNIRGDSTGIPDEQIRRAVLKNSMKYPRYLLTKESGIEINLKNLDDSSPDYWKNGFSIIDKIIERRIFPAIEENEIPHISIFSLARIPFIIYLGNKIGDKVSMEIGQKLRNGKEEWIWQEGPGEKFFLSELQKGTNKNKVALLFSLSVEIPLPTLPSGIDEEFTIYQISPQDAPASRDLFKTKATLEEFRSIYEVALRKMEKIHPNLKELHVFPAVPVSAAFHIGRELQKDVSPTLLIYDKHKDESYNLILSISPYETRK